MVCSCCSSCGSSGSSNTLIGDPVYEIIVNNFPSGAAALADSDSPQRAAFDWLNSPFNDNIINDERRVLQRYALASFFYATGGSRWDSTAFWLSGEDECNWFTSSSDPVICDTEGNVITLSLHENGLDGSIPAEISLLSDSLRKSIELSGLVILELVSRDLQSAIWNHRGHLLGGEWTCRFGSFRIWRVNQRG